LGRGAFGKVNLALHKICQKLVAIKSIDVALLENQED
jgi:serine/threonine protein kinase